MGSSLCWTVDNFFKELVLPESLVDSKSHLTHQHVPGKILPLPFCFFRRGAAIAGHVPVGIKGAQPSISVGKNEDDAGQ